MEAHNLCTEIFVFINFLFLNFIIFAYFFLFFYFYDFNMFCKAHTLSICFCRFNCYFYVFILLEKKKKKKVNLSSKKVKHFFPVIFFFFFFLEEKKLLSLLSLLSFPWMNHGTPFLEVVKPTSRDSYFFSFFFGLIVCGKPQMNKIFFIGNV